MSDALHSALGPAGCLTGTDVPAGTAMDASRSGRTLPRALLRPASVAQVAKALAICQAQGLTVVPQGGLTGLAGGAQPGPGDVALSLDRFAGIEAIDADALTMTLRAGTILQHAQEAASAVGLHFPVDLGARGSARIGGIIATNAGGLRVIRDGMTRDNLLGLEVVLADGTVLNGLSGMVKNNTGYDLRHLFAGSEGTLGVITRAVFRLRPAPAPRATVLAALPDFAAVLRLLTRARALPGLSAFEAMWQDYFDFSAGLLGARPFAHSPPIAVLMEADETPAVMDLLEAALADGTVTDALIAQSVADARAFWDIREGLAIDDALPGLINLDVSIPMAQLDAYARAARAGVLARFPRAHVSFFGHVADSNLHVALALPQGADADAAHEAEAIAYDLVRDFGGSVSAEHGIGTLKRPWLGHTRSAAEIAAMTAIKAALDPQGRMNPGKIFAPE